MRLVASVAVLMFASLPVFAEGPKTCEDLKSDIAKKLDANGVKGYTLEIVAKDMDADGKVVGSCDGGTKKIVYSKASAAPAKPAPAAPAAPKK
jgi:Protein of unknown function (DUF1161)